MSSPRIAFRADASLAIGHGHVMRCLNLAEELRMRGANVEFICSNMPGHLNHVVRSRGFPVRDAAADLELSGEVDWLVVDHYGIDARWHSAARKAARRILVIDDLADRPLDCDLLIDQNLVANMSDRYDDRVTAGAVRLLGPRYALIPAAYAQWRNLTSARRGVPARVLIAFGGSDEGNLTKIVLDGVLDLELRDVAVDVVVGSAYRHFDELAGTCALLKQVTLYRALPTLAPLIAAADIGIGAGGSTTWERMCLGLPTFLAVLSENQRASVMELSRLGHAILLGDGEALTRGAVARALQSVFTRGIPDGWSERCSALVDGRGVQRVASVMLAHTDMSLSPRLVTAGDEDLILEWANDPQTRGSGFSPAPISKSAHHDWMQKRLEDKESCRFFIVEDGYGTPIGQVRFQRADTAWEIHYAVAPEFRGRGIGAPLLESAIKAFHKGPDGIEIFGKVRRDNVASARIFEKLGFRRFEVSTTGDLKFTSQV